MEVSGQLHSPAAIPSRKEHPVRIAQETGWAPEPVWMPPSGIEPRFLGRPYHRLMTVLTKLWSANCIHLSMEGVQLDVTSLWDVTWSQTAPSSQRQIIRRFINLFVAKKRKKRMAHSSFHYSLSYSCLRSEIPWKENGNFLVAKSMANEGAVSTPSIASCEHSALVWQALAQRSLWK
jgi:hypothetical protein